MSGLTVEPAMFTLEPDGSQIVTVTFPSSTAGTFSGNITISSNDPRATQTLSVSVIVQAAPVPAIKFSKRQLILAQLRLPNRFTDYDSEYGYCGGDYRY